MASNKQRPRRIKAILWFSTFNPNLYPRFINWILLLLLVLSTKFQSSSVAAYSCDFDECRWKLDLNINRSTDSSVRLSYEIYEQQQQQIYNKDHNSRYYGPRGRIHFALLQGFLPGEMVYFVSPWFNNSAPSCTFIYDSEILEGNIQAVILTQNNNNIRLLESNAVQETLPLTKIARIGEMNKPFRVGFKITAKHNGSRTLVAFYQVHLQNCSKYDRSSSSAPFCPLEEIPCTHDTCIPRDHKCDIKEDCDIHRDEHQCDNLPFCAHCTFESGFCCWRNSPKDNGMQWVRHNGPTPSPKTGPQGDHTNGTGHFVYTHRTGTSPARAVLESVVFPPPPEQTRDPNSPYLNSCQVRFFYHFHGYYVVSISLVLVNVCNPNQRPLILWSTDEPPGGMDTWRKAVANINISFSYSLEINGICGIGDACDIAIDDITFSPECFGFGLLESSENVVSLKDLYTKNGSFYSNHTLICSNGHSDVPINTRFGSLRDITSQNVLNVWLAISVLISLSSIISGYIFWRRRQRLLLTQRMCRLKNLPSPLSLLPHNRISDRIGAELNPTYDLGIVLPEPTDIRHLPRTHVHLLRPIGQGAFGEVYEGFLSNIVRGYSEYPVAIKTLPALSTEDAGKDFIMEAIIMSKFNHPNIVNFFGVCFEAHPKLIVLELLNGGDLRYFLRENRPKSNQPVTLTSKELLELSLDIAKGCQYLEMNRFIHRDIAARNCLLTSDNTGTGRKAKIADFGMARDIYRSDYYRKDGRALLPVKWMPPEAFIDGIFSTKTDVWSFGVLLWEIFSLGCTPYPGQGNQDVIQHVAYGARMGKPRGCSAVIYDIMLSCWRSNADERPDFNHITEILQKCTEDEEVLSHPLPDSYCPLIVEVPPEPLAPPYKSARKVRPPKFYTRRTHQKDQMISEDDGAHGEHTAHGSGPGMKLSYAAIGFTDCEEEEIDGIDEEEEEEEEEEDEEEGEEEDEEEGEEEEEEDDEEEEEEEDEEEEEGEEEEEEGEEEEEEEEEGEDEGEGGEVVGRVEEEVVDEIGWDEIKDEEREAGRPGCEKKKNKRKKKKKKKQKKKKKKKKKKEKEKNKENKKGKDRKETNEVGEQNGDLLNERTKLYNNEEEEEEETDCYGESDGLLLVEAFRRFELDSPNQKRLKDRANKQLPEKSGPYQNQLLSSSLFRRENEQIVLCPQTAPAQTTDKSDAIDKNEESFRFNEESIFWDVNDESYFQNDNDSRNENCGLSCFSENHSLLSKSFPRDKTKLYLSKGVEVVTGVRHPNTTREKEHFSLTQMVHANSLPTVHYQNCDTTQPLIKKKLHGVFSLT